MYLGYSDPKGIIYIFDGEFKKPIVQFHKSLNKRGYKNIAHSYKLLGDKYFGRGIHINSQFVLLSQLRHYFDTYGGSHLTEHQSTFIWYKKKNIMVPGFQLPNAFQGDTSLGSDFFALNSTHIVFLVGYPYYRPLDWWHHGQNNLEDPDLFFAVKSLHSDNIALFSETLPINVDVIGCRFTIGIGGSGKETESKLIFCACISGSNLVENYDLTLLSYNLKDGTQGQWKTISELQTNYLFIRKCQNSIAHFQ